MNADQRARAHQFVRQARASLLAADPRAALDHVRQALHLSPGSTPARLLHARILLKLNKPADALSTLQALDWYMQPDAAPVDRHTAALLTLRGQALLALHRPEEALRALDAAVDIRPCDRPAGMARAMALVQIGRVDDAADHLRKLHRQRPDDRRLARLLGDVLDLAGKPAEALSVYRRGRVVIDPLQRARLARRGGMFADALDRYELLLRKETHDIELLYEAAQVAEAADDDRRLHRWLDAALELDPMHRRSMVLKAENHMVRGEFEKAASLWALLKRRDGTDAEAAAGYLVCSLSRGGRDVPDAAIAGDADAQRRMARLWVLAIEGKVARQIVHGEASPMASGILATLLHESSQVLDQASASKPHHADLHYHRAVCAEALGETDKAAAALDEALAINAGYVAAVRKRIESLLTRREIDAAAHVLDAAAEKRGEIAELLDLKITVAVMQSGTETGVRMLAGAPLGALERRATALDVAQELSMHGQLDLGAQWRRRCEQELGITLDVRRAA
jgi:tetratricopeptide (TPR) repeat protein